MSIYYKRKGVQTVKFSIGLQIYMKSVRGYYPLRLKCLNLLGPTHLYIETLLGQ